MRAKLVFRCLLMAFAILTMIHVVSATQALESTSSEVTAYERWWSAQPLSMRARLGLPVTAICLLLANVAVFGLVFFKRWARTLFTISIFLLVLAELTIDLPVLKSGAIAFRESLLAVLAGIIIGRSYGEDIVSLK